MDKMDDNSGEINPYHEIVTNKVERDNTIISQMEQWSILSNKINYVQYSRHQKIIMIEILKLQIQKVIRKCIIRKRKDRC